MLSILGEVVFVRRQEVHHVLVRQLVLIILLAAFVPFVETIPNQVGE
jgi:hypothetical protein